MAESDVKIPRYFKERDVTYSTFQLVAGGINVEGRWRIEGVDKKGYSIVLSDTELYMKLIQLGYVDPVNIESKQPHFPMAEIGTYQKSGKQYRYEYMGTGFEHCQTGVYRVTTQNGKIKMRTDEELFIELVESGNLIPGLYSERKSNSEIKMPIKGKYFAKNKTVYFHKISPDLYQIRNSKKDLLGKVISRDELLTILVEKGVFEPIIVAQERSNIADRGTFYNGVSNFYMHIGEGYFWVRKDDGKDRGTILWRRELRDRLENAIVPERQPKPPICQNVAKEAAPSPRPRDHSSPFPRWDAEAFPSRSYRKLDL